LRIHALTIAAKNENIPFYVSFFPRDFTFQLFWGGP
jgi:hypothetical protein